MEAEILKLYHEVHVQVKAGFSLFWNPYLTKKAITDLQSGPSKKQFWYINLNIKQELINNKKNVLNSTSSVNCLNLLK
jgi:hypothetical protein